MAKTNKKETHLDAKKQLELDEKELELKQNYSEHSIFAFINKNRFVVLIMCAIIALTAYFMYRSTMEYPMVFCDDNIFILDYKEFNKPAFNADSTKNMDTLKSKVKESFTRTFGTSYYRPMLGISFLLDAHMSKDYDKNPEGVENVVGIFHRTNIFLHVIGSIFVFGLLVSLGYRRLDSFIFGMLFTLHPMLTPAASWISGRNDSLLAMFVSIAFVVMVQIYNYDYKTALSTSLKIVFYLLFAFFFTLALYTKEVIVFYPFVFLAYVLFFRKDNPFKILVGKKLNSAERDSWIIAGIMSVIGFYWYFVARADAIEGISNPDTIGWEAFFKNYMTLPAMIGKIFLPIKAIALPSFEPFSIITGFLITAIIAYLIISSNRTSRSKILFGLAWFLFFLFPTLFIRIVFVDDFFDYAEHRAYLPIIGIFLIVIELMKAYKIDFTKKGALAIAMLVLAVFGFKSYTYKETFNGRKHFWGHMVDLYPDKSRGYLDLGKAFLVKGEVAEAERLYKRGIVLNPNNKNLYIDLGVLYLQTGRMEESIEMSKKAISIDPNDGMANYNLGWAYFEKGQYAESVPFMEAGINRMGNAQWGLKLGKAYYFTGKYKEAVQLYNNLQRVMPNNPVIISETGLCLFELGSVAEAEKYLTSAIQIAPGYMEGYVNLFNFYIRTNRPQNIRQVYQAAAASGVQFPAQVMQFLKQNGVV